MVKLKQNIHSQTFGMENRCRRQLRARKQSGMRLMRPQVIHSLVVVAGFD